MRQSRSEGFGKDKNLLPMSGINPDLSATVTVVTNTLSTLHQQGGWR